MSYFKSKKISNFLDNEYKEFAFYTISSRGIPSFYDTMTPNQRLILTTTPPNFTKSLNVVGDMIKNGYHHGNSSLESSLTKTARPFLNSYNLIHGDGFFGNEVNSTPAACRYTSVKIDSKIKNYIDQYKSINPKGSDYFYQPMKLDFPLGLLQFTIGIAVGFASKILPRKYEEINKFLDGKKANLTPYLQNYGGDVLKASDNDKSWLFRGTVDIDGDIITLSNIPPFIKYNTFLKKLNSFISDSEFPIQYENLSKDKIILKLKIPKMYQTVEVIGKLKSIISVIITENIVLTIGNQILEYNSIKDYLIDFKNYRERNRLDLLDYDLGELENLIEFIKIKIKFIDFMLQDRRSEKEIKDFYKKHTSSTEIRDRLDNIKIRSLSDEKYEELKNVTLINELDLLEQFKKSRIHLYNNIQGIDFSRHNVERQQDMQILKEFQDVEQLEDLDIDEDEHGAEN